MVIAERLAVERTRQNTAPSNNSRDLAIISSVESIRSEAPVRFDMGKAAWIVRDDHYAMSYRDDQSKRRARAKQLALSPFWILRRKHKTESLGRAVSVSGLDAVGKQVWESQRALLKHMSEHNPAGTSMHRYPQQKRITPCSSIHSIVCLTVIWSVLGMDGRACVTKVLAVCECFIRRSFDIKSSCLIQSCVPIFPELQASDQQLT